MSPTELGYYVVALSLSRIVFALMTAINGVMLSKMTSSDPIEARRHHDHAFRFTLFSMFGAGLTLAVLTRFVLVLLYGAEFEPVVPLFRLLLIDSILMCVVSVTNAYYQPADRPGFVSIVEIVGFATFRIVVFALAPQMGAMGATIAMPSGSAARFTILFLGLRLHLGGRLPRFWLVPSDLVYLRDRLMPNRNRPGPCIEHVRSGIRTRKGRWFPSALPSVNPEIDLVSR